MSEQPDLEPAEAAFLQKLFEAAHGEADQQVDMYVVGETEGLDRTAARRMAENLIGWELLEIRTLAGGVSLTTDALAYLQEAGLAVGVRPGDAALGEGPVLVESDLKRLERLAADLKARAGERSWHFSALDEFMADLKTLEAQFASPRPKTAVVQACLASIAENLSEAGSKENLSRVKQLLGQY